MYRQAEVRIVEPQQEQSAPQEVSGYEAAALMAKYGFSSNPDPSSSPSPEPHPNSNLTFEEMVAIQEREMGEKRQREQQRMNGPRAYSFDGRNVSYSETKYSSVEGENFGIQIQIVSDMPINRYNR
jgi:hypothetical protein